MQNEVLIGIVVTNIAAIAGFFMALRVSVAKLEVKVDIIEEDINNLGDLYRSSNNIPKRRTKKRTKKKEFS